MHRIVGNQDPWPRNDCRRNKNAKMDEQNTPLGRIRYKCISMKLEVAPTGNKMEKKKN